MKCLSFFLCSGAKPRLGDSEGKAQVTTQRAETREVGIDSLPRQIMMRPSVQPPTGAVAGGGLISLRGLFARAGRSAWQLLRHGFPRALRLFIVGHRERLAIGLTVDLDYPNFVDRRVLVFKGEGDRRSFLLG